jgi:hypothetical protein
LTTGSAAQVQTTLAQINAQEREILIKCYNTLTINQRNDRCGAWGQLLLSVPALIQLADGRYPSFDKIYESLFLKTVFDLDVPTFNFSFDAPNSLATIWTEFMHNAHCTRMMNWFGRFYIRRHFYRVCPLSQFGISWCHQIRPAKQPHRGLSHSSKSVTITSHKDPFPELLAPICKALIYPHQAHPTDSGCIGARDAEPPNAVRRHFCRADVTSTEYEFTGDKKGVWIYRRSDGSFRNCA